MVMVETAAIKVLGDLLHDHQLVFYSMVSRKRQSERLPHIDMLGRPYRSIIDDYQEMILSDLVVYWGDFQHARGFLEGDADRRYRGAFRDRTQRPEVRGKKIRQSLLLSDAVKEDLEHVFSIGTTLAPDILTDEREPLYLDAAEYFFSHIRMCMFRDSISVSLFDDIVGRKREALLGVDAAFFHDQALLRDNRTALKKRSVGFFFGHRSVIDRNVGKFISAIDKTEKRRSIWIPWFADKQSGGRGSRAIEESGFFWNRLLPKMYRFIFNCLYGLNILGIPLAAKTPFWIRKQIKYFVKLLRRCSYVVTDTYHLSIACWSVGIPAVCILGENSVEPRRRTLGNEKKKYLYEFLGIGDFLVKPEDLKTAEDRLLKADLVRSIVDNPEKLQPLQDRVNHLRDETRDRIAGSIMSFLSSSKV